VHGYTRLPDHPIVLKVLRTNLVDVERFRDAIIGGDLIFRPSRCDKAVRNGLRPFPTDARTTRVSGVGMHCATSPQVPNGYREQLQDSIWRNSGLPEDRYEKSTEGASARRTRTRAEPDCSEQHENGWSREKRSAGAGRCSGSRNPIRAHRCSAAGAGRTERVDLCSLSRLAPVPVLRF
jgi:hypothetical protein